MKTLASFSNTSCPYESSSAVRNNTKWKEDQIENNIHSKIYSFFNSCLQGIVFDIHSHVERQASKIRSGGWRAYPF
jgi:hypothetical protein